MASRMADAATPRIASTRRSHARAGALGLGPGGFSSPARGDLLQFLAGEPRRRLERGVALERDGAPQEKDRAGGPPPLQRPGGRGRRLHNPGAPGPLAPRLGPPPAGPDLEPLDVADAVDRPLGEQLA